MKTTYTTHSLYGGKVMIKFYEKSHRYQLDGDRNYLVGATTAIGMMDKSAALLIWAGRLTEKVLLDALESGQTIDKDLISFAINQHKEQKEAAATIGSAVHDWIEQYIYGCNPEVPTDPNVRNGVLAFLRWVKQNDVKFLESERIVYSREHEYVGTMDCIFTQGSENHKVLHVGDYKTSSGFYMSMPMQLSAYQKAHQEEFGKQFGDAVCMRLDKETGNFHTKNFSQKELDLYFEAFLGLLACKKANKVWEKEHGYYAKK